MRREDRVSPDGLEAVGELARLLTEAYRPELADLNLRPPCDLVELMNAEARAAVEAVEACRGSMIRAIDAIIPRVAAGGRLVYQGAGSAGRIGALDAAECGPTFGTDQVIAIMAGGIRALSDAVESAEDQLEEGKRDLERLHITSADAVVGISASGRTPYVIGGVQHAAAVGALTVAVVCNEGSELSRLVEQPIEVLVGPEIIAGSTRLKAGTAQKLVLNAISTIVMVKLNKTYGNLMVNMRATNSKLQARAERMLMSATGRSQEAVRAALDASADDVRVAMMMLVGGIDREDALARLAATSGDLHRAMTTLWDKR